MQRLLSRKCTMFSTWCSYLVFLFGFMPMFPPESTLLAWLFIAATVLLLVVTAFWAYLLEQNLQLLEGDN
jgi:hypothetical protein